MEVYCLDLVTPGTYLYITIDKTDIVYALNQYVGKLKKFYGHTMDSNTTDKQVNIFRIK
jgi:hypothetical protein